MRMSIAFCLPSPWLRVSILKNTPKTVFKICLKINLVEFFFLWGIFFTIETAGFSFKTPYKQPVYKNKLGLETGFHFKYPSDENGL